MTVCSLIAEAVDAGARQSRACETVGISERTVQRWRDEPAAEDRRAGPKTHPAHALSDDERAAALALANRPEYRNLSPERVVAKAADAGEYICSERSLRRIQKAAKQNVHRERSQPASPARKPREYAASAPLRVLSWDITYLRHASIRGAHFYLYLYIDVWSRMIVGFDVHEAQTSELAAALLRRICDEHGIEANTAVLHQDNGAPMKGATFLATMDDLGITKSFSRPRVSDDNAFIESLFRHLKYAPEYPSRGFETVEHARAWVARFVHWYNHEHLHSGIGFVTPAQRHDGEDIAILERRRRVYAEAQRRNPRRWAGATRRWKRPAIVTLNPARIVTAKPSGASRAA